METCFLLTGKPRTGKSTAIKRIIQKVGPEYFGGFYTEEIHNLTNRTGFNCVTLNGENACIANVDSESSIRQPIIIGTICADSHPSIDKIKKLSGIKLYHLNEENRELIK